MRAWQPKDKREERETPGPLAPLFMIFLPPWACLCKLGQPGVLCSTWGPHSGPWTFHCSIFTGFPLPCLLATAILESFFLFYLTDAYVFLASRTLLSYAVSSASTWSLNFGVCKSHSPSSSLLYLYLLFWWAYADFNITSMLLISKLKSSSQISLLKTRFV